MDQLNGFPSVLKTITRDPTQKRNVFLMFFREDMKENLVKYEESIRKNGKVQLKLRYNGKAFSCYKNCGSWPKVFSIYNEATKRYDIIVNKYNDQIKAGVFPCKFNNSSKRKGSKITLKRCNCDIWVLKCFVDDVKCKRGYMYYFYVHGRHQCEDIKSKKIQLVKKEKKKKIKIEKEFLKNKLLVAPVNKNHQLDESLGIFKDICLDHIDYLTDFNIHSHDNEFDQCNDSKKKEFCNGKNKFKNNFTGNVNHNNIDTILFEKPVITTCFPSKGCIYGGYLIKIYIKNMDSLNFSNLNDEKKMGLFVSFNGKYVSKSCGNKIRQISTSEGFIVVETTKHFKEESVGITIGRDLGGVNKKVSIIAQSEKSIFEFDSCVDFDLDHVMGNDIFESINTCNDFGNSYCDKEKIDDLLSPIDDEVNNTIEVDDFGLSIDDFNSFDPFGFDFSFINT